MLAREVSVSDQAMTAAEEELRTASRADKLSLGLSISMSRSVPTQSREENTTSTTAAAAATPPTVVRDGTNNASLIVLPHNMVKLNVYDITEANALLSSYGLGVHHLAVEVYEMEVAYGRGVSGPGVFTVTPRQCEPHMFREQYLLGITPLSKEAVQRVVERLTCDENWAATAYHLIHHNCHHFAEHLCALLLPPTTRQAQQGPALPRVREVALYRALWTEQVTGESGANSYTLPVLVPPHLTRICRVAASCLPQRAIDKLEEMDRRSCVS